MLSIEECREKLGKIGKEMADSEIEKLRNQLYALIDQLLDNNEDLFTEP